MLEYEPQNLSETRFQNMTGISTRDPLPVDNLAQNSRRNSRAHAWAGAGILFISFAATCGSR